MFKRKDKLKDKSYNMSSMNQIILMMDTGVILIQGIKAYTQSAFMGRYGGEDFIVVLKKTSCLDKQIKKLYIAKTSGRNRIES
ncbi:hypothetical protein [Fusibacter sp. 3D3]|uniref:hypothetical protein n=1 Tax=Fusibacter sp. 3D3 TaxID=1048380 RepID=UPI000852B8C4|nr:hypothetical protein [Fusibacter sp. 3D3]GAU80052.1 hypothetical protein F3D3_4718 [Fusibacter sp. 3D3]